MSEPVRYMDKSRDYYAAQGFEKPYVWANFEQVPFASPAKPLAQATLTIITTSSLHARKPLEPRQVASFSNADPPDKLHASDLSWDKQATHMDDRASYLPIEAAREAVSGGRIGQLSARFHCAPTDYSQRRTIEKDAPELLARANEDGADIALLVPL